MPAPRDVKADLLALALTVGTRHFAREVVLGHFREEMQMLKETSFIEEWANERAREMAPEKAREMATEMAAKMAAEKKAEGRAEVARELLLQLLQPVRHLPASVVDHVNREEPPEWCRKKFANCGRPNSLADLGL